MEKMMGFFFSQEKPKLLEKKKVKLINDLGYQMGYVL
jgi:hypothetical protein